MEPGIDEAMTGRCHRQGMDLAACFRTPAQGRLKPLARRDLLKTGFQALGLTLCAAYGQAIFCRNQHKFCRQPLRRWPVLPALFGGG